MKKFFSTLTFFLIIIPALYSQDFGEFSDEELKLENFDDDPGTDYIVLIDQGTMRITEDFNLKMHLRKRIKILTEEGKKQADIKFSCWHEDDIFAINAISITPEGKVYELDSDNIFEEEGEKRRTFSFAIPGIVKGSVIEYEYTHLTKYITSLPDWYFQSNNFTVLSEVTFLLPVGFSYKSLKYNLNKFDIKFTQDDVNDPQRGHEKVRQYKWIGKNIPALKEEPFVDNVSDKYAKLQFVLESYHSIYQSYEFAKSWDEIAQKVYNIFEESFDEEDEIEKLVQKLTANATTNSEKAKILFDYVKNDIYTSDHKTLYGESFKEPLEVIETKEGSSSEKNMLLTNMLRTLEFNSNILLVSTRSHGDFVTDYPEPLQFNRLLCYLKLDNQEYFLHTAMKSNNFGYLTPATSVENGFLVGEDGGKVIKLNPLKYTNIIDYDTECTIVNDVGIKAKTKIIYSGLPAVFEKDDIEELNEEDLEKHITDKIKELYEDAILDTFYYSKSSDCTKPLELYLEYTLEDFIDQTDELSYFSFPQFSDRSSNPFKSEKRYYDIEYSYPIKIKEDIKLYIPENLTLIEVPKKKKVEMYNYNYGKYMLNSDKYILSSRIEQRKSRNYDANYYQDIKQFYSEMIAADNQQVVLKKN